MSTQNDANITGTVRSVCNLLRTTLGPFGANKIVIQEDGTVKLSSSGSNVIDALEIENPAVTLLTDSTTSFQATHGDGTSRLVAIVGALLENVEELTERGVHPTAIERGYREALRVVESEIDEISLPLTDTDPSAIATTALTNIRSPPVRHEIGELVVEAVRAAQTDSGGRDIPNAKRIGVTSRLGGAMAETELIKGVVFNGYPVLESMPRVVNDCGIALLSAEIDVPQIGTEESRRDLNISQEFDTYEEFESIGEQEREMFHSQLQNAFTAGCQVILTSDVINDRVKGFLQDQGFVGIQRVDDEVLERIALFIGADVLSSLDQISSETMGYGDFIVERVAGREMTVIESAAGVPVYTIFCRAPDPRATDDFERAVEGAVWSTLTAVEQEQVVPGGGATETAIANAVRDQAYAVTGREQLAMEGFSEALTTIPRLIAANSGMNGREAVLELRSSHADGNSMIGIDGISGELRNVTDQEPIIDPAPLVQEVIVAATDLVIKLCRIDDILPASDISADSEEKQGVANQSLEPTD